MVAVQETREEVVTEKPKKERVGLWDMLPGLKEGAYYTADDLKRIVKPSVKKTKK